MNKTVDMQLDNLERIQFTVRLYPNPNPPKVDALQGAIRPAVLTFSGS